jgi:hypothetical protein
MESDSIMYIMNGTKYLDRLSDIKTWLSDNQITLDFVSTYFGKLENKDPNIRFFKILHFDKKDQILIPMFKLKFE